MVSITISADRTYPSISRLCISMATWDQLWVSIHETTSYSSQSSILPQIPVHYKQGLNHQPALQCLGLFCMQTNTLCKKDYQHEIWMYNEDTLIRKTILKNNLKESIQVTGKQQYLAGYLSREKLIKYTHIHTHMSEFSIQCSASPPGASKLLSWFGCS